MAALAITKQTIHDGARNLVVKVTLVGTGSNAAAVDLINMADYAGTPDNVKVTKVTASLDNFHCTLLWEATTDVPFLDISSDTDGYDFTDIGGLVNTFATGYTGDIQLTTTGVGTENGTLVIYMKKRIA